ncbi:hypothetical protein [Priestia koreensis]|uniref:Uncharacterized protein n=1 Tax=Priestia koreensis TaxID=284581 RepID=A0A0M0LH98_9BACI|nr:hypothetical protein [Priestia koreensis]KOO50429.1 hypothetical protein AMD01_01340 [Priestia koreensis]
MKILINYANNKYKKTQKFNSFTGKYIGGFDKVYSFGPEDIDEDFQKSNFKILNQERGNGLWLWKPYFILKVMKEAKEGDVIFYCDSGSFFLKNINPLVESIRESDKKIWVSNIPLLEVSFTKPSCFKLMDCDSDYYKYTNQIQATFFLAINNAKTRSFVEKWLNLCSEYKLVSPENGDIDSGNSTKRFISHREDQSILSLLCKREGIQPCLDPTQRGKYPAWYRNKDYEFVVPVHTHKYSPMIFLHKTPNIDIVSWIKQYLVCLKRKHS